MADTELVTDRTPLLERKGSAGSIDSNNKLAFCSLEKSDIQLQTDCNKYGISNVIDVTDDPECMSPLSEENLADQKQSSDIVCIFTVAFDTRAGNFYFISLFIYQFRSFNGRFISSIMQIFL